MNFRKTIVIQSFCLCLVASSVSAQAPQNPAVAALGAAVTVFVRLFSVLAELSSPFAKGVPQSGPYNG